MKPIRLGTKFVLLVVGTLVVPFVAFSVIGLIAFASPDHLGLVETYRTLSAVRSLEKGRVEPGEVPGLILRASPELEFLVFDGEYRLLASSSMERGAGRSVLSFNRILARSPDGDAYFVFLGLPGGNGQRAPWARFVPVVVIGSVLAFLILMSLFIIRSINSSIAHLEEGTRRICQGDLEFELDAEGTDRIASLTRSFDEMRRRVREDSATRSRFIMSVSHDLKTPLSSIMGYVEAIADGMASDPGKLAEYVAIIRDKAGLLESRISQLIDYVKLDTGEWKRTRERTLLAPFLHEAVTVFRSEAEARGYGFQSVVEIPGDLAVTMDGDLVYRALENLANNAFRYSDPSSVIRFEAVWREGVTAVRIVNRGKAVAAEDLPYLFEPFYRGTKARRDNGFGLGLSVVQSVVTSHGWTIAVASRDGETSFTVSIPDGGT